MQEQLIRTAMLLGEDGMEKLKKAKVAVFGVGGVGGHAIEALVRSGIGKIDIIDDDSVCESNINRQLIATHKTVGMSKVKAMKDRILEINPNCEITIHECFYLPETAEQFDFTSYDYIIDAIDTVTAKIDLAVKAKEAKIPLISSMGAGNKIDPTKFVVTDIYKTSVCPLAKVMRKELKKRGIEKLKVVYSTEEARKPYEIVSIVTQKSDAIVKHTKRATPGSLAFVPAVAGLILAGEVIKELAEIEK